MIATRSKTKECNSPKLSSSPYKTRKKRKSEEADLRQFQETVDIKHNGKTLTLRKGFCYLVSLSNKTGWLRIDKLWIYDETIKMEATCFTRPSMNKTKKHSYGQDQLIPHNAKLVMNEERFKRMYIQNKIPPKTTSVKTIKKSNVIDSVSNENDSVELVQSLHNSASDQCDHDYAARLKPQQQSSQKTANQSCNSSPPDPTTVKVELVDLKHLPQQEKQTSENVQRQQQDSEDPQTSKQTAPRQQGSMTLSTKRVVQRTKELTIYYQMKNSLTDIKDNVSASAIVQSLGFARFNAGPKRKSMTPIEEWAPSSKVDNVGMILPYKDYCLHCKLKRLLEAGGIVLKEDAVRYHVVTDKPNRIFYFNIPVQEYAQSDDWVIKMDAIDDIMYEKYTKRSKMDDEQLNKLAGKYRRQTI
ncbi:uncharacterized protein [Clytia hemisphaerica]